MLVGERVPLDGREPQKRSQVRVCLFVPYCIYSNRDSCRARVVNSQFVGGCLLLLRQVNAGEQLFVDYGTVCFHCYLVVLHMFCQAVLTNASMSG